MSQKANFQVNISQGTFAPGTVGGDWHWILTTPFGPEPTPENPTVNNAPVIGDWTTADPYSSMTVDDGQMFIIYVQRTDKAGNALGPMVKAEFATKGEEEDVIIDVAGSVSVTLTPSA